MQRQKQMLTVLMLTGLLFSGGGVKAQDPISNNAPFGAYTGTDQDVIINNDPVVAPVTGSPNNPGSNTRLNFLGGDDNFVDGPNVRTENNLLYGRSNEIIDGQNNAVLGDGNLM
jgi:hypothetical protein